MSQGIVLVYPRASLAVNQHRRPASLGGCHGLWPRRLPRGVQLLLPLDGGRQGMQYDYTILDKQPLAGVQRQKLPAAHQRQRKGRLRLLP